MRAGETQESATCPGGVRARERERERGRGRGGGREGEERTRAVPARPLSPPRPARSTVARARLPFRLRAAHRAGARPPNPPRFPGSATRPRPRRAPRLGNAAQPVPALAQAPRVQHVGPARRDGARAPTGRRDRWSAGGRTAEARTTRTRPRAATRRSWKRARARGRSSGAKTKDGGGMGAVDEREAVEGPSDGVACGADCANASSERVLPSCYLHVADALGADWPSPGAGAGEAGEADLRGAGPTRSRLCCAAAASASSSARTFPPNVVVEGDVRLECGVAWACTGPRRVELWARREREGGREGKEAVWEGRREVEGTRVSVREIEGRGCATDGRGSTTCSPTSRADAGSTCSTCSTAACGTSSACTDGVCACASRRRPLVDVLQCPSTLPTRRSHRPSCCGLRPPPRAASLAARATSTGPCDRYVRRRRVDMPSTGQIVGARGQEGGSTPTREVELRERGRRGGGRSGGARYVCWTKWAMRTAPRGVSAEAELEGGRVGGRREGHAGDERAAWLVAHVARAAEVVQYEVREQICTDQGRRVSSERAGRARSDELGGGRGGRESDAPWADSSMPWVELKTSIVTAPCLARAVARRGVVSGSSPYQSLLSSSRPSRRRSRPGRCW